MKIILIFLLSINILGFNISKKKESIREKNNIGITTGIGSSDNLIGINIDLIIKNLDLELSLSTTFFGGEAISLGGRYLFSPEEENSYYLGLYVIGLRIIPDGKEAYNYGGIIYIPIGCQFMWDNGFTTSIDIGIILGADYPVLPSFGLKIGYYF